MTRRPVRASPAVCQRADAGYIRGQAVSVEELGELGYALDCRRWWIRKELALAIFDYIEAFYNPKRQHSSIGNLSSVEFEGRPTAAVGAA